MKKVLFYFIAITITISCKTKSDLTVENFESPQVEQKMQKSYGSGGKIIYGTSEGSQNDSPSYTQESNERNNHTPPVGKEDNKRTQEKNKIKNSNKKSFGFNAIKIRPFPKKAKKSSTKQPDYKLKRADGYAKWGFAFPFIAVLASVLLAIAGYAGLDFLFIVGLVAVILLLILGIVFSIAGLKSERFKALAIIGLILSIAGIVFIGYLFLIGY